jgi:hypothetical protein
MKNSRNGCTDKKKCNMNRQDNGTNRTAMRSRPVARDEELQRENTRGKPYQESPVTSRSRASNYWREARHLSKLCCGGCWRKGLGARLLEKGSWMHGQKGGPRNALPVFYRGGSPLEMALMPYIFAQLTFYFLHTYNRSPWSYRAKAKEHTGTPRFSENEIN